LTTAPASVSLKLVTLTEPASPASEAYRTLRTNIHFSSLDTPLKTLLITGTDPGEGKSTTLANLAVTMAQAGNRVLVIDCDLRRPSQHRIFGLKNLAGLTTMMVESDAKERPPLQETAVPNLRLLSSGPLPPNPSELLGSRRMAEVLTQLKAEADIILLDAPPIIAVADAAILAARADGVLLVVQANKTRRDLAKRAKAALEKANANLLGVVLNNVKLDTSIYGYYAEPGDEPS
jgi:capsular exopolysaccharide synthesis family protein